MKPKNEKKTKIPKGKDPNTQKKKKKEERRREKEKKQRHPKTRKYNKIGVQDNTHTHTQRTCTRTKG
jgi:hypothetical protein